MRHLTLSARMAPAALVAPAALAAPAAPAALAALQIVDLTVCHAAAAAAISFLELLMNPNACPSCVFSGLGYVYMT